MGENYIEQKKRPSTRTHRDTRFACEIMKLHCDGQIDNWSLAFVQFTQCNSVCTLNTNENTQITEQIFVTIAYYINADEKNSKNSSAYRISSSIEDAIIFI